MQNWAEIGQSKMRRGMTGVQVVLVVIIVLAVVGLATCIGILTLGSMVARPALEQARMSAMAARSTAQLQQIELALQVAHNDPDIEIHSLEDLVAQEFITRSLLNTPAEPLLDGSASYWVQIDRPNVTDVDDPTLYIVSYDRATYAGMRFIAACTLDGRCETYLIEEFRDLLEHPVNADRDFDLPIRPALADE